MKINTIIHLPSLYKILPSPVTARVCGRTNAWIASSNPAEGMHVRLLNLLCVVQVTACATS